VYKDASVKIPDIPNLKIIVSKAPDNLGVGKARYLANTLYAGETYYLQVDSHTRFIKNWDEEIVSCYNLYKQNNLNPVITTYPARYWYENGQVQLDPNMGVTYIDFKHDNPTLFKTTKFLHQIAKANPENNIFTRSISGGSMFSSGSIHSIEPNTKVFNWGEEMLHAVRLFTHGYDLVLPQKQYLYHLYYDHSVPENNRRNLAGNDFPEIAQAIFDQSFAEVYRVVSGNVIGPQELGTKRTLQEYEIMAGVNFKTEEVIESC
jgi:hypothetical protein